MTRRVFVVEHRMPGESWEVFVARRHEVDAHEDMATWRDDEGYAGCEWRVVECVPRDGSGG